MHVVHAVEMSCSGATTQEIQARGGTGMGGGGCIPGTMKGMYVAAMEKHMMHLEDVVIQILSQMVNVAAMEKQVMEWEDVVIQLGSGPH